MNKITFEKKIIGYAYPRNGNTHNPTPRVSWSAFVDGKRVGVSRTRREAREIAELHIACKEDDKKSRGASK
jgi:hypothetical protein